MVVEQARKVSDEVFRERLTFGLQLIKVETDLSWYDVADSIGVRRSRLNDIRKGTRAPTRSATLYIDDLAREHGLFETLRRGLLKGWTEDEQIRYKPEFPRPKSRSSSRPRTREQVFGFRLKQNRRPTQRQESSPPFADTALRTTDSSAHHNSPRSQRDTFSRTIDSS